MHYRVVINDVVFAAYATIRQLSEVGTSKRDEVQKGQRMEKITEYTKRHEEKVKSDEMRYGMMIRKVSCAALNASGLFHKLKIIIHILPV
jgi:flagellar motor switch protein FliM